MPIYCMSGRRHFPPVHLAGEGLLAYGGDLSPERLLLAYASGIFPWYDEPPILWWAPKERLVLYPNEMVVSRRLCRKIRTGAFEVTFDLLFSEVIHRCASQYRRGQQGTWINADMIVAYCRLYEMGYAHSVECHRDGKLVGGLYGVSLGGAFFGESMFSVEPDSSRTCLVALAYQCKRWKMDMIDCQMYTEHLARMGAHLIPRTVYMAQLRKALRKITRKGHWLPEPGLLTDIQPSSFS